MHFDWQLFEKTLSEDMSADINIESVDPVSGGDTSRAFQIKTNQADLFVKLNNPDYEHMFRLEWSGLIEIASSASIRTPQPVTVGRTQNAAYFVMEYMEFVDKLDQQAAGKAIADLHHLEHTRFGWDQNNFIGKSVQHNEWHADWAEFYWNCRLDPQLEAAVELGHTILENAIEPLRLKTMTLLEHHSVEPSLLHGDLWYGNIATSIEADVVLYDPAVYWGDPETDIAATKLFGGFTDDFYDAYYQDVPLQEGADTRLPLYQLYHWLNHLNMFGASYLEQCLNCISELYADHRA